MGERNARQALRRIAEDADPHAGGLQPAQYARYVRVAAKVDGSALLGVTLEQLAPVRQLFVERGDVDAKAAPRIVEPIPIERLDVAERCQVDGDGFHRGRRRSQTSIPTDRPTASMATSIGDA